MGKTKRKPETQKKSKTVTAPSSALPWRTIAGVALAFAGIVSALYANTLASPFVYDDVIIRDSSLIHINRLSQLRDVALAKGVPRKVGLTSFALNFYFGQLDPRGYRLVNLAVHALNGIVLFLLSLQLLRLSDKKDGGPPASIRVVAVFLGTAVWLVHPVQTQAVAYVWQRLTSLGALFYLLSLSTYLEARSRKTQKTWFYAAAVVFFLLAVGTKENTATLPLFVILAELLFLGGLRLSGGWSRKKVALALAPVVVFALLTAKFLGPNFVAMMKNDAAHRGYTLLERQLTELRVVVHYVGLLVYPHPSRQNVDYDYALSRSLIDPPATLLALILIAGLLGLAVHQWRRRPLLSFAIFWYFGNLAVESSVIPLDLVYEHRLYLPSMVPVVLAVAFAVKKTSEGLGPTVAAMLPIPLIGLFGLWTVERNRVWQDPVSLWSDNARKSPGKARVHGNLGKAYLDKGDYSSARESFERAVALDPSLVGAQYNLAVVYLDYMGDTGEARRLLEGIFEREPDYVPAHVTLGVIHLRARELEAASARFEKVLELEPTNALGLFNLAGVHFNRQEFDKAVAVADRGVGFWPSDARLYALLGASQWERGASESAAAALRQALTLDPRNEMALMYWEKLRGDEKKKP